MKYPNGPSGLLVIVVVEKVFNPEQDSLLNTHLQVENDVQVCHKIVLALETGARQHLRNIKIPSLVSRQDNGYKFAEL